MIRKKKNNKTSIKKTVLTSILLVSISLFIIMALFICIGGVASSASENLVSDYKNAADIPGCSWQELLAFDTVRFNNDFENVNPYVSVIEFMLIDIERYELVEINSKEGVRREWVLAEMISLNSSNTILQYLRLDAAADAKDVQGALNKLESPEFKVNLHAKDIEDLIVEFVFEEEQKEWLGLLLTDGLLSEMFGDDIDLPDFIGDIGNGYFAWPVPGNTRITSRYGPRSGDIHYGLDIAAPIGSPVIAIESGVVTGASPNGGTAGTYVKIKHEKDGRTWESKYFHLSAYNVSIGQNVERGSVIANSGNTGFSTGPHLHLGITINGVYTNPEPLIKE